MERLLLRLAQDEVKRSRGVFPKGSERGMRGAAIRNGHGTLVVQLLVSSVLPVVR